MSNSAAAFLFAIAWAGVSLVLAVLFSTLVALTLLLLSSPLWYIWGYGGGALVLALCFALVLGLTAYLTPALYRNFRYSAGHGVRRRL